MACQTEAAQLPHGGTITALAVAAGGETLYAGSSTGHVMEYRLRHSAHPDTRRTPASPSPCPTPSASPASPPAGADAGAVLLAACKAVGKKPVEALCLLPAARTLAALCDGAVSLVNLDTLHVVGLPSTKGAAQALATDHAQGGAVSRLAVLLKRRVLFYTVRKGAVVGLACGF